MKVYRVSCDQVLLIERKLFANRGVAIEAIREQMGTIFSGKPARTAKIEYEDEQYSSGSIRSENKPIAFFQILPVEVEA